MLIGLTGHKRVGKSTLAKFIVENYNFKEFAFAEPLKQICKILFDLDDSQIYENKEEYDERWKTTPRNMLQIVGTELFRNELPKHLPQIHESMMVKLMSLNLDKHQNIVISDIRFKDEEDFVKKNGGIIIKIIKKGCDGDNHESEKIDGIKYDYMINNDLSYDVLYKNFQNIFENLFEL